MRKKPVSGSRKFDPTTKIKVRGATAPSGAPYLYLTACGASAWLHRGLFRGGGRAAEEALAARNIVLLGNEWTTCKSKALKVTEFPPRPLIEHPGWDANYFALADGTVISPPAVSPQKPVVLFSPVLGRGRTKGTTEEWLRAVAVPLAGQQLAKFIIMAMFAAPLLRIVNRAGNFGFELAGPKGVGKSTLQILASSVAGPALSPSGNNYWRSANATAAGLEGVMAEHADMPLVIEETNLFAAGESDRNRAAKLNELVFRLSDGSVKARYHDHAQRRFRFIYLTSTNEPLEQILGGHRAAVSDAAADRLLTLPIGSDRPHGIFDYVPKRYFDAAEFAAALTRGASRRFGTAMRTFLEGLVEARFEDADALKRTIEGSLARFRTAVGADMNSGSATRVADVFGLVYAAGILAKQFGALPDKWNCLTAARAAYELNRSTVTAMSYRDRILRLARAKGVLDLSKGLPSLSDADLEALPGLVGGRNGRRELLLTPKALERAFPDRRALFRDEHIQRMMVTDEGRKTVKRRLRDNHSPERVHCFRLPKPRR